MKYITIAICCLCAIAFAFRGECADTAGTRPTTATAPAIAPSGDPGTDAVVAFYRELMKDTPPTVEQEQLLLKPTPGLRSRLIAAGLGTETDAVILVFLRKHRELFLPRKMRSLNDIGVSSTFHWVQSIDRMVIRGHNPGTPYHF